MTRQDHHTKARPSNDQTPHAVGEGVLRLGSAELPCAMLSTGESVLTGACIETLLGASKDRNSGRQIERIMAATLGKSLRPRIAYAPKGGGRAHAYPASMFVGLCEALVDLKLDGKLHPKQEPALVRARIILAALGRAAIETMVADACGVRSAPGDTEARFNEALRQAVAGYEAKVASMEQRVRVLEAGSANGGVVGEWFSQREFMSKLRYAAGLLSAARNKPFQSTYRSLRNKLEREAQYGKRGQRWAAFPANPERVSDALAFVNRTVQDAEREHRTWVDTRPSPQMHFDLFAA